LYHHHFLKQLTRTVRLKRKQIHLATIILQNVSHSFAHQAARVCYFFIFPFLLTLLQEIRKVVKAMRENQLRTLGPLLERVLRSADHVRLFHQVSYNGLPCYLAAPLNLANSPSLHLLTPAEQTLCSQLRILPKPYLVIKETLVREYARRGGKLRRREARDLVKIDANKTSRVWDFLVQAGFLKITPDLPAAAAQDTSYV
jgi:hypothetical protein